MAKSFLISLRLEAIAVKLSTATAFVTLANSLFTNSPLPEIAKKIIKLKMIWFVILKKYRLSFGYKLNRLKIFVTKVFFYIFKSFFDVTY